MAENGMVSIAIRVPCCDGLLGEFAQRGDERSGCGVAWPEFRPDLDERGRQRIGGLEQQSRTA